MKMKTGTKNTLLMIAGIVITLLFLFPLYWMITTSLRPPGETFSNPSFSRPGSVWTPMCWKMSTA